MSRVGDVRALLDVVVDAAELGETGRIEGFCKSQLGEGPGVVHGTGVGRWSAWVVPYTGIARIACAQATAWVEWVCAIAPIPGNAL